MRRAVARGKENVLFGETPYGWKLSRDRRRLVVDRDEQRVMAVVRHMRSRGMTIRAIVAELKSMGVVSRRGRPFGIGSVFRMLERPSKPPPEAKAPKPVKRGRA
jgi:hypothetical protein